VWDRGGITGVGGGRKTISYYVKGPVVAFLLDAKIRRVTKGEKTLDDLMKLAYQRHGGERGFTAEEFRMTASDVAGVDMKEWLRKAVATTEELDYTEALDWFGLRFAVVDGKKTWRLEIREDATQAQRDQLKAWLEPTGK